MLMNLQVRDFAIVDQIDIEFADGMTVLTGETGAGKSILIDAIGLVLGERGNAQLVRTGAKRAEFSAQFDTREVAAARKWLKSHELDMDDECLLRRVINADGRSRAFINGNAVPLAQLKRLGELLLDIHGQHFHQSLVRRGVQRDLLDHFGELTERRHATELAFRTWRAIDDRLQQLLNQDASAASRVDLLQFQLQELETLNPLEEEYEELQVERQRLQNSGRLAEGTISALNALLDDDTANANSLIAEASRSMQALAKFDDELENVVELLDSAAIQVSEASDHLRQYSDSLDMDPQRRDWVEGRIDALQGVSRKHRVKPVELTALMTTLSNELDSLNNAEQLGQNLEREVARAKAIYDDAADRLSSERAVAAKSFAADVAAAMQGLGMPGGKFEVALNRFPDDAPREHGIDALEFLIGANPGQPLRPLSKVASGGELSRMSLSIQVIASSGSDIQTMIFDEVDSGVGGGVAEMVGRRLQQLSATRQVLCVTHLPQVASQANQHFRISKVTDGKTTRTQLQVLEREERIDELARMLGGVEITQKTREHAAEMLAGAAAKSA